MKKIFSLVLISFMLFGLAKAEEIPVESNVPNALKDAVDAAQSDDVLLLEYGGFYFFDGSALIDKNMTIRAYEKVAGDAATKTLPFIAPIADGDGGYSSRMFDVKGNLTLENIEIRGSLPENTNHRLPLNLRADNLELIIRGCVISDFYYATVRTDNRAALIDISDSKFLADRSMSAVDNGRWIELRGKGAGKVVLQNNTIVNATSMWFHNEKWAQAAPHIDTLIIDHCTFMHHMGQQPSFDIRSVKNFTFTNNIVANPLMLGSDDYSGRIPTWDGSWLDENRVTESGPYSMVVFAIVDIDSFATVAAFHNNNIYLEAKALDTLTQSSSGRSTQAALFTNDFLRVIDPLEASFEEELTFGRSPATPFAMVTEFITKVDTVAEERKGDPDNWLAEVSNTMELLDYWDLDMTYGTSAASYSAAENGFPLGDLNWYPEQKERWAQGMSPVGISGVKAVEEALLRSYPNPFFTEAHISYNLVNDGNVSVSIYDISGSLVKVLVNQYQARGSYTVQWGGDSQSQVAVPGGLYFGKLQLSDGSSSTVKLVLIK